MTTEELIHRLSLGEDSRHQFKVDVTNADSLAAELAAFSNTAGGTLFIGVEDDGRVTGLTHADIARINQLLSNAASQNVRPPVNPLTETLLHPDGVVMVVSVPAGINKPYLDKNGVIWVKSAADKRRATSREELQRMFQAVGVLHADETPVRAAELAHLDMGYLDRFVEAQYGVGPDAQQLPLKQLLVNMNLSDGEHLNVAGVLLFTKEPQYRLPAFMVKAVAFPGVSITDEHYIDSRDIVGKLSETFDQCVWFLMGNTGTLQNGKSVNSIGEPEVPRIVWEELVANALIHRDYFISAPIRLLVFTDRVEIISPGHLPNNLTLANVKAGNSNIRNPILASYAAKLLPYRGLGSGILRALKAYPHIEFIDDREGNLFKVVVKRADSLTKNPSA